MADFTAVVEIPDAPAEEKGKALVNRGLTKALAGDTPGALADYTAAIEMPDAPAEVKAAAQQGIERLSGDSDNQPEP